MTDASYPAQPVSDAAAPRAADGVGPMARPVDDCEHPDYLDGIYADPDDDPRGFADRSEAARDTLAYAPAAATRGAERLVPIRQCGVVSGRYRVPMVLPPIPRRGDTPPVAGQPTFPIVNRLSITVRVDVDRYHPQRRISIEVVRPFPQQRAHAIATVAADNCIGVFRRRIEADITYRDGVEALIPAVRVIFEATRDVSPTAYSHYQLTLVEASGRRHVHPLLFESRYFDSVEFEVDSVENAQNVVTAYDTGSHPNRPTGLPSEVIDFQTTFRRAGFDVSLSPNGSVIPLSGTGSNGTWSDAEMHNAMIAFWSRFGDRPQWAMWVLFAARHDRGGGLGGIMFDDIGPNHRQGTAIFTDSFIVEVPPGDAAPDAWRNRNVYWTAVHEMGHAFNLAHSWQKSLGRPQVEGDPWIPLLDEPEARSFMNYPDNVAGEQQSFFSDFAFRFSDNELIFMRHAPRRFVQMGNENWFENHAFERRPDDPRAALKLHLRANREECRFSFLEPVKLELKLENVSGADRHVAADVIEDGHHVAILVKRDGGPPRKWKPLVTHCHAPRTVTVTPGTALYASHLVAVTGEGWLIDEPGFYTVQAACHAEGVVVVSNPLRIFVGTPESRAEEEIAPEFFTENVGRVLAFQGAPDLPKANDVLRDVVDRVPDSPAATHAAVSLATPLTRDFKRLRTEAGRGNLTITSTEGRPEEAVKEEAPQLLENGPQAARTLGHIDYRDTMETLSGALSDAGNQKQAVEVQKALISTMEQRGVLERVVSESKARLAALSAKK